MQATTTHRTLLIRWFLAAAPLLLLGIAPAQASGAEVIAAVKFDSWFLLYFGEFTEEGTIEGKCIVAPDYAGTFEGWIAADGTLVLQVTDLWYQKYPHQRVAVIGLPYRVRIDLETGYAEAYELAGAAHVVIRD